MRHIVDTLIAKSYSHPYRDWERIKSPAEDQIVPYAKLPAGNVKNLNKLAVLKVNGGLGTSMGASHIYVHRDPQLISSIQA